MVGPSFGCTARELLSQPEHHNYLLQFATSYMKASSQVYELIYCIFLVPSKECVSCAKLKRLTLDIMVTWKVS